MSEAYRAVGSFDGLKKAGGAQDREEDPLDRQEKINGWRRELRLKHNELSRLSALPNTNQFKQTTVEQIQRDIDHLEHLLENY
jgi:acyl-CoA reductase-like NAD-dependent aldehyde dehydrogenase